MVQAKTTIPEILYHSLNDYSPGIFSSTKRNGAWVDTDVETYLEKVRNLALGLYKLGVRRGDKVSLHAESSTEWLMCDLAILSIGAASVPIYTTQPADQIIYILNNSDAKVHIVSTDELFAKIKPKVKELTLVKSIISLFGSAHSKLKSFEDVLEMGAKLHEEKPKLFETLKSKVKSDDLATLIYTSGTTGLPKGVMLTHHNITSNVEASKDKLPYSEREFFGQDVLTYLPLSHIFERIIDYMYIVMGCKIHYIESVEEIRDDLRKVKPFFMATVPRLLEKIHTGVKVKGQELSGIQKQLYYWAIYLTEGYDPEHPPTGFAAFKQRIADKLVYSKIRELFGGNMRGVVSGGAALSPEIFKFMNAIGFICVQGYGLTETSPAITVQDRKSLRIGSSGKVLRGVQVKIEEDGEILVKGPNVMKGYYKDEEKTSEVLSDSGWFSTGDIGRLDEEGYLFITDRKKALFKLSIGKYVSPQYIENQLGDSGFIDQAVVVGYQKKFCSALIVPAYENVKKRLKREGYDPIEPLSSDPKIRELIQGEVDKTNKRLSPWETIKKFVLLDNQLTIESGMMTPTMKVKRGVVRETYSAQIDSMYAESE